MEKKVSNQTVVVTIYMIITLIVFTVVVLLIPTVITGYKEPIPINSESIMGEIIKVDEKEKQLKVSYSIKNKEYKSTIKEYTKLDKKGNAIELYVDKKNPEVAIRSDNINKLWTNKLYAVVAGLIILLIAYFIVFKPLSKVPVSNGVESILIYSQVICVVMFAIGLFILITSNIDDKKYVNVEGVIVDSNPGDKQIEAFTIIKYNYEDVEKQVISNYYRKSDFFEKKINLYINKNDSEDVRFAEPNLANLTLIYMSIVIFIFDVIMLIPRMKRIKDKKRLIKEVSPIRAEVRALMYDKKVKVKGENPQYAEVVYETEDRKIIYITETYSGLIKYSESKPITEVDLYVDPLDNEKFAVIFDFEKIM